MRAKRSKEAAASKARRARLALLFRTTPEEWDKVDKFQKRVCAITGKPPGSMRLSLDHDHKTGALRGLLSPRVNRAIAMFDDNPVWLRAAADYLENPPYTKALGKTVYGLIGRAKRKKKMIYGPPVPPTKKEDKSE